MGRLSTDRAHEEVVVPTIGEKMAEKDGRAGAPQQKSLSALIDDDELDFYAIGEKHGFAQNDGRLVVDPEEARVEYGEEIAQRLKVSHDGRHILWPQPTKYANDPQNWTKFEKNWQLFIITAAAFVPDFSSSLGIAGLFPLAAQFDTTVGEINNLTSNWSIFMLGVASFPWICVVKRYGRLAPLFWSQLIALGFLIGCAVAPNLSTFAACRILAATFGTAPQVLGLYTICDMFPFHLQARKINLWTLGFVISPFVGPSFLGFMVSRTSWRWIYGVGCIYNGLVVILIAVSARETMFDRHIRPIPMATGSGIGKRIQDLVGITGIRMAKYRPSWGKVISEVVNVIWRPQALLPAIFVLAVFGFGIGINVTNAVFVGSPPPAGYGLTPDQQAGTYFSPVIGCLVGEFIGRYLNDFVAERQTRRNSGVFTAEMRLWTLYPAVILFIGGFIGLGYCFQYKLNVGGVVMSWAMAETAILMITVTIYAYLNNCFPAYQGETSAIVNFWRTMGGFAVPYFQVEWAESRGASETFGVEAAITAALFLLVVPFLQLKGEHLRAKYSIRRSPMAPSAVPTNGKA